MSLDGEWEFYWQQLRTPQDFGLGAVAQPQAYAPVPNVWGGLMVQGQPIAATGYATYRLVVYVKEAPRHYGLLIGLIRETHRVWVNGVLISTGGQVGQTAQTNFPGEAQHNTAFTADTTRLEIIVQVSGYATLRNGLRERWFLGTSAATQTLQAQAIALELLPTSAFIVIGLYHLVLYLFRRKEAAFAFFGVACLALGVYTTINGNVNFTSLMWPALGALWIPLNYWSPTIATAMLATFVHVLYPQHARRDILWGLLGAGVVAVGVRLFTDDLTYASFFRFFGLATIAAITVYTITALVLAARARRPEAALFLGAFATLGVGAIQQISVTWLITPDYRLLPWGLLITILGQTVVLSRRVTRALNVTEALAEHLQRTNQAYYRFVPRTFLQLLGKDDIVHVQLGDQTQQEMTVLFADVREFTALSERMTPAENFGFVNALFGGLSPLIRQHHGFIDKYLGDGIMAIFPRDPADALHAAIAIQQGLVQFNAQRTAQALPRVQMGLGLHSGKLMLGTVGEPERMDGTVIANAVNIAARMESLTKHYGVSLIASESTLSKVADLDATKVRVLGVVRVKGQQLPITVCEVFESDPPEVAQLKDATRTDFEVGLYEFQAGNFAAAQQAFAQVVALNPQDRPAYYYREKAAYFAAHGLPAAWDEVEALG